ncbi:hypothetical protein BKA70DRAFT_733085 [Coprinopsis sp. MPI-PUGE-AT-0042]|nr:hypothetical protein BKA70DRAFT_733085 [Coprinopsis sp. MPI-PUGE-AT-0042]
MSDSAIAQAPPAYSANSSSDSSSLSLTWKLRAPAIESLCKTFSLSLGNLEAFCAEKKFLDKFELYRSSKRGVTKLGPFPLTSANLAAAWNGNDADQFETEILFLSDEGCGYTEISEKQDPAPVGATSPQGQDNHPASTPEGKRRAGAVSWMATELGVSPYFFDSVFRVREVTALQLLSSPSSCQGEEDCGPPATLNGVYPVSLSGRLTTVWFSHFVEGGYSLYIVNNCTPDAMSGLERFLDLPNSTPFLGVDAVLLDDTHFFHKRYMQRYKQANEAIKRLDHRKPKEENPAPSPEAIDLDLDALYAEIYSIYSTYSDTRRTINLLRRTLASSTAVFDNNGRKVADELLENMEETRGSREVTIGNTLAQLSTLMNFKVAVYSSQTAEDAKRDASAMATIALVTMLFLPGSFVAAFFSTSFVTISGGVEFKSSTWVFAVVTVSLTAGVFLWFWFHGSAYYSKFRNLVSKKRKANETGFDDQKRGAERV